MKNITVQKFNFEIHKQKTYKITFKEGDEVEIKCIGMLPNLISECFSFCEIESWAREAFEYTPSLDEIEEYLKDNAKMFASDFGLNITEKF